MCRRFPFKLSARKLVFCYCFALCVVVPVVVLLFAQLENPYILQEIFGFDSQFEEWLAKSKISNSYCLDNELDTKERYAMVIEKMLKEDDYLLIAANWKNAERQSLDMFVQILKIIEFLSPGRVAVSIFESGSTDRTKDLLRLFAQELDKRNVTNRITMSFEATRAPKQARIEFLSSMRNELVKSLKEIVKLRNRAPNYIWFLNDIYFCAVDIQELLFQAFLNDADLVSGLDFDRNGLFYDTWVAKDILGFNFDKVGLYTNHSVAREGVRLGIPIQCVCTWNGAAIVRAAPFLAPYNLKFCWKPSVLLNKSHEKYESLFLKFGKNAKLYEECPQSEISQMCKDMINFGFQKCMMIPRIKVAYEIEGYYLVKKKNPRPGNFDARENEKLHFLPLPDSQECIPLTDRDTRDEKGSGRELLLNSTRFTCRF